MFIRKLIINLCFILKHAKGIITLSREKKTAKYLLRNALKLSTAESCTGGLISSRLTDVSGSSAYIFQNFVTYANAAKVKLLGVNSDTIEKYGYWGILLFVGIPLPGTGAWTGSMLVVLLGLNKKKSIPYIVLGVLLAGIIMSIFSYGILSNLIK